MVLCRRPLLFVSDAIGAAGIGVIMGGVVLGVLLPLQLAVQARPAIAADLVDANARYDTATARNHALADTIRSLEGGLAELSGRHHSETGEFVEFLSAACAEAGFRLQQVTPQGLVTHAGHRSWDAQMSATGPFAAFPHLLAEIEGWSPFVQVSNLSVTGPAQSGSAECVFSWTVRVNSVNPGVAPAEAPPK